MHTVRAGVDRAVGDNAAEDERTTPWSPQPRPLANQIAKAMKETAISRNAGAGSFPSQRCIPKVGCPDVQVRHCGGKCLGVVDGHR
eukprot:13854616-Alexandrium_andersonii.AAC.1